MNWDQFSFVDMSDEEAESQSSQTQNEGGPGNQSGIAKLVKENFAMLTENMKMLVQAVQTLRTDVSQLKWKAPSITETPPYKSNPRFAPNI